MKDFAKQQQPNVEAFTSMEHSSSNQIQNLFQELPQILPNISFYYTWEKSRIALLGVAKFTYAQSELHVLRLEDLRRELSSIFNVRRENEWKMIWRVEILE